MRSVLLLLLLAIPSVSFAEPFTDCPAKAFLTQGKYPQTYAVNLVTGDYQILASDMGTSSPVNGLGFNPNDQYIYGWSYEHGVPARVHSDFSIEPLPVANLSSKNFYVGDVSSNNKYYVYRPGSAYGLYSIGLDPQAEDYLVMNRIIDGGNLHMRIADMAFHPYDGFAYAVESNGNLRKFNVETGQSETLATLDETGTYGAAYFDADGNLYISRNTDGKVFRIAIDSGIYEAELFALGPKSSTNDGSRCALAPVIDVADVSIDFGDAPDTYGTSLDSNGARHGGADNGTLFLGQGVDGESDAFVFPLSDGEDVALDEEAATVDEDGVQFVTRVVEDGQAITMVEASSSGLLGVWIDLDRNGTFDSSDQVLADYQVNAGKQAVYLPIPVGVDEGETWARFRLSTSAGMEATGGVADGEVEDYRVSIYEKEAVVNFYPSETGWATVAFEDNWPHEGDYDMNDLVVYLRTSTVYKAAGVSHVSIKGEVAAVGAAYHNGFAIRLPGIPRDAVDEENMTYLVNGREVNFRALESGRDEAILITTYNLFDFIATGNFCEFFRTEEGCGSDIQMTFEAEIPLLQPVDTELSGVFDPFLFATPGAWHGGHFVSAPGRSYEIHLKNREPTEAFDSGLFEQEGDDASSPESGLYFQTSNGLPFALEIGSRWNYPIEYLDIGFAYYRFAQFATSQGSQFPYWYDTNLTNENLLFKD